MLFGCACAARTLESPETDLGPEVHSQAIAPCLGPVAEAPPPNACSLGLQSRTSSYAKWISNALGALCAPLVNTTAVRLCGRARSRASGQRLAGGLCVCP